jgi:aspartyl aminopeptidase
MEHAQYTQALIDFIAASPTPFHAVAVMSKLLEEAGFTPLREADAWRIEPGGRYYVTRNGSSLIAFTPGARNLADTGMRMVGAHTDSPCLKVKPAPEIVKKGYFQVGVEVYGGALLNPWFDRDLSLAGRVTYRNGGGAVQSALIDFKRAVAVIPSLAIHLDREANENRKINKQTDLPPLLMRVDGEDDKPDFRALLRERLVEEHPDADVDRVLDYDLCLYDTQPPALVGLKGEFIAGARLDNLLSCFAGLGALLDADPGEACVLVCNDHEEVGSVSSAGAQGPFLKSVLRRLTASAEDFNRAIDRSMLVSADNAHGVHPNFTDRHDDNHGPLLNKGPVIKINANQRYASNSETSAHFRHLCELEDVPVQSFVVRTDMACGSTIGPLTAAEIGVSTVDVGVPQFAMHSVRELAGSLDALHLYRVLRRFYASRA